MISISKLSFIIKKLKIFLIIFVDRNILVLRFCDMCLKNISKNIQPKSSVKAILVLAQLDFVIGTFLPPSEEKKAKGFVGYSMENYNDNFWSAYTMDERTGNLVE